MLNIIILIVLITSSCTASEENENGLSRKHHLKLHHGVIHYWAFLAIKAKIIFLIGSFISFWVFAGKAFAFLYYVSRKEKCGCHDSKIIYDSHFDPHKYGSAPIDFLQKKIFLNNPTFQQQKYSTIRNPYSYATKFNLGRSIEHSLFGNIEFLKSMIKKADLTEFAFEAMQLNEKSCKMRFVCEADQSAQDNGLLAFTLHLFSDTDFMKYRTNVTDCKSLGTHCSNFK